MRKFVPSLLALCLFVAPAVFAQGPIHHDSGVFYAPVYNTYRATVQGGPYAAGSVSVIVSNYQVTLADGYQFVPWATTNPVNIGAGSTLETLTPSAVSTTACPQGGGAQGVCALLTLSTSFTHGQGDPVVSGSAGVDEAVLDANANGGGIVMVDNGSPATDAIIAAAPIFSTVSIQDNTGPEFEYWSVQPSTLTAISAPSILTTGTLTFAGTGTWVNNASSNFCITYVDALGGESPCSTLYNVTPTNNSIATVTSPAASTGAVGWRFYGGISSSAVYQVTITSANCMLTTLEQVMNACAIGSNATFSGPVTTTMLFPTYTVNTYNGHPQSHTTFAWVGSAKGPSSCSPQSNFGPFTATAGGTTTQIQVLATVQLSAACLNKIGRTIKITGKIAMTNGTAETPQYLVQLGPTFSTGTPKNICVLTDTTALTAAANSAAITCTMTVNATGATGTVMADGFSLTQLQAGTTAGAAAVDSGTAAITSENLVGQDTLYITYIGTGGTSTAAQLLDLHIEDL